jgi:hypothetical protein
MRLFLSRSRMAAETILAALVVITVFLAFFCLETESD